MKEDKVQFLKNVTLHQCKRLESGSLFLRDCALVHIAPSETVIVNGRLWDKLDHLTYKEYFRQLGGSFFEDGKTLPYVVIPWNYLAEQLNTGLRNAWRFNFEADYQDESFPVPYITYDLKITRAIWSNIIRTYRNRALSQLDVEFQMALEKNEKDGIEEIGVIRQMLRDLPHDMNIEKFETVEQIVSFWPTILLPAPDFVAGSTPAFPADGLPAPDEFTG